MKGQILNVTSVDTGVYILRMIFKPEWRIGGISRKKYLFLRDENNF